MSARAEVTAPLLSSSNNKLAQSSLFHLSSDFSSGIQDCRPHQKKRAKKDKEMSEKEIPGHRIDKLEAETLIGLREGKDKKAKPWLGKRSNGEKVKANRRSKYEEGGKRRKQNERESETDILGDQFCHTLL